MYWMTFLWPWPKVTAVALIKKLFVCRIKVRTTQPITIKFNKLYPAGHAYYLIWFWWNFVGTFFGFFGFFFKVKHSIGHISEMVGPIDVKRIGGASVGYWVNYVTSTFDHLTTLMTLTFDFSRSNFKKKLYLRNCYLIDVKQKEANQLDTGPTAWFCPLTTPMTLTL